MATLAVTNWSTMSLATPTSASLASSAATNTFAQGANWMASGSLTFELVKGIPTAIVALLIGLIAAGIAFRQTQIAHAKLKLDLFDRRYELYILLREFLMNGTEAPLPGNEPQVSRFQALHRNFDDAIPQAYFLFGREIGEFFELTKKKVNDHNFVEKCLHELPVGAPNRHTKEEALLSLSEWTSDERVGLIERFSSHMSFERWR